MERVFIVTAVGGELELSEEPFIDKPEFPYSLEGFNERIRRGVITSENDYVDYRYEEFQYYEHLKYLRKYKMSDILKTKVSVGDKLIEGIDFEIFYEQGNLEPICISKEEDEEILKRINNG